MLLQQVFLESAIVAFTIQNYLVIRRLQNNVCQITERMALLILGSAWCIWLFSILVAVLLPNLHVSMEKGAGLYDGRYNVKGLLIMPITFVIHLVVLAVIQIRTSTVLNECIHTLNALEKY